MSCACGCGLQTTIADYTDPERGYVCGQPKRFVAYHHRRMARSKPLSVEDARRIAIERSIPEPNSGCLLWLGAVDRHGYAQVHRGKTVYLGRALLGITDRNIHACHRCDTPSCVNEDHLFRGSRRANMRDMIAKGRNNNGGWKTGRSTPTGPRPKTHCKRGHAFTPENTRYFESHGRPNAGRACLACKREWHRNHKRRGARSLPRPNTRCRRAAPAL